jgi:hypothetical protein
MFRPIHRERQLIVERDGEQACVGCGHFVCTIRREVVQAMPTERCQLACGGWSEAHWIDFPPDRLGYWRLATTKTLAYHMGNTPEPWMDEYLAADEAASSSSTTPLPNIPPPRHHWTRSLGDRFRQRGMSLVRRIRPWSEYR